MYKSQFDDPWKIFTNGDSEVFVGVPILLSMIYISETDNIGIPLQV
jgi:hypothetical protein